MNYDTYKNSVFYFTMIFLYRRLLFALLVGVQCCYLNLLRNNEQFINDDLLGFMATYGVNLIQAIFNEAVLLISSY